MSRTVFNFWLDLALLLLFLCLIEISAILQFVFPAGSDVEGWTLWARNYWEWRDFQFELLCVLGLAVLLHVMLHWDWVCAVFTKSIIGRKPQSEDASRTLYGVGLLILILMALASGLVAGAFSVRPPLRSSGHFQHVRMP